MAFNMIDVSSNNHPDDRPINWNAVAHTETGLDIDGVMIKCTEGMPGNREYINPWLARDAHGAHAAGLHIGYYHFAWPRIDDSEQQCEFALETIKGLPRDLGLALDLEEQNGLSWDQLSEWAFEFLSRISADNISAPLYSNQNFLSNMPKAPFNHKLWFASPSFRPRHHVWAWQHTATARVNGIVGDVDLSVVYG